MLVPNASFTPRRRFGAGGGGAGPLASDDFNRADAGTLGGNWTANLAAHPLGIFNNGVCCTTTTNFNVGRYTAISWPNDQASKMTCIALPTGGGAIWAVGVRKDAGLNSVDGYWGGFDLNDFNTDLRIWKCVANIRTSLATLAATPMVAGNIYELTAVGDTLTLYENAISILSVAGGSVFSSGDAAITMGSDTANVKYGDDWSGRAP